MLFLGIETLEKCHILKMWHVIGATRNNFSPKRLILHFYRDVPYLENQKTVFGSKLF
jgi:hypothetical protein